MSKQSISLDEVTLQALKKAAKKQGLTVEKTLSQALKALKRETDAHEEKYRCPHDGGTCHHNCADEVKICVREEQSMSLTTPHEGYPLPGHKHE